MTEANDNPWMKPADVAGRWKVSPQHVINLCRAGELKHMKVGRLFRIHAEAVIKREKAATPEPPKKSKLLDDIPDHFTD